MKRALLVISICLTTGCGNFGLVLDALQLSPTKVTVRLINETAFEVNPAVFVTPVGDLLIDALTEAVVTANINEQTVFGTLAPGEDISRDYDCDDIQAFMVKDAELQSGIGISPEADSDLFLVDEDFECGDVITVRYTGGLTGFRVQATASRFDAMALIDALVPRN